MSTGGEATGLVFVTVVLAVLFGAGFAGVALSRPPATHQPPQAQAAFQSTATTGGRTQLPDIRAKVVSRLEELLRLRDAALGRRDVAMLSGVYTYDCAALKADRQRIRQLLAAHTVWAGLSTRVRVLDIAQDKAGRWVLKVVTSTPIRVTDDHGKLLHLVAPRPRIYQIVLARPAGTTDWLIQERTEV